jgi:hypothetical protein
MQTMRSVILATLLLTSLTFSLPAQDPPFHTEEYSEAYADSSHATHWSVYIPVVTLVAAALWLAAQNESDSKGSVGGNGSLADSKSHYSSKQKSYSTGSYSHSGR